MFFGQEKNSGGLLQKEAENSINNANGRIIQTNSLPSFSIRTMEQDLKKAREGKNLPAFQSDEPSPVGKSPLYDSLPMPPVSELKRDQSLSLRKAPEEVLDPGDSKPEISFNPPTFKQETSFSIPADAPAMSQKKIDLNKNKIVSIENKNIQKRYLRSKKAIIAVIFMVLTAGIIFLLAFFFYARFFPKKNNNPINQISADDTMENPQIIKNEFSLLEFSDKYDFNLDSKSYIDKYKTSIKAVVIDKINSKEILFKENRFLDIQMSVDGKFLDSEEMIDGISESFPPEALDKINRKGNLILHLDGKEKRAALVFDIITDEGLIAALRKWESSMAADLSDLFLDGISKEMIISEPFKDAVYKEENIRYLNMPLHNTTIDYAVADNMLIITTSKESMFKLVDFVKNNHVQNQAQYQ